MARTMFKRRPWDNTRRNERMKKWIEEGTLSLRRNANLALKHFNESSDEKGTEYELVREAGCGIVEQGYVRFKHINFLAKPKGAPDNEVKLFFTEIKNVVLEPPVVISCSILGPEGVVTGAGGCRACDYRGERPPEKAAAQHPLDGNFVKGVCPPTTFQWEP